MSGITVIPNNGNDIYLNTEDYADFYDFRQAVVNACDGRPYDDDNDRDLESGEVTWELDEAHSWVNSNLSLEDAYDIGKAEEERDNDGAAIAYVNLLGGYWDKERFEEAYQGRFDDDKDFACDMAEQLGLIDSETAWPHSCIDWNHAARELMYDYSEEGGHYFRDM